MIGFPEGGSVENPEQLAINRLIVELPHLLADFSPSNVSLIEEYWGYIKDDPTITETKDRGIIDLHKQNKSSLESQISGDKQLRQMLEISKTEARTLGVMC